MTTKWTPGPWQAVARDYGYDIRPKLGPNVTGTEWMVGNAAGAIPNKANADLIAAAPALASALAAAVEFIALALEDCTETMPDDCAMLARARAALAAAGWEG